MPDRYIGSPEAETRDNVERAKALLREEDTSIPWGLTDIDKRIGSPRPGQFVVLGARSGNGKTTFLLNWLIELHNQRIIPHEHGMYKTCYMGTEMEPPELMRKWAAIYLNYDEDLVLSNKWKFLPPKAKENVELVLECLALEDDHTWLPSCMHPALDDVLDNIDKAVRWGAHIIIFDHLHRLRRTSAQDERSALSEAAKALKTAAQECGILVVAASQMRREEHGLFEKYRPPHLGSFGGSSEIEGNADIALGLYRPLKKMTVKQERAIRNGDLPLDSFIRKNTMALKCVKHRSRGSVSDTTVLLTLKGGRIENYVEDPWEEINQEDQHAGTSRALYESRAVRDMPAPQQLPENSSGENCTRDVEEITRLPQVSFDL